MYCTSPLAGDGGACSLLEPDVYEVWAYLYLTFITACKYSVVLMKMFCIKNGQISWCRYLIIVPWYDGRYDMPPFRLSEITAASNVVLASAWTSGFMDVIFLLQPQHTKKICSRLPSPSERRRFYDWTGTLRFLGSLMPQFLYLMLETWYSNKSEGYDTGFLK